MLLCGSVSCESLGKGDMYSFALLLQGFPVSAWSVRVAWTGQPLPLMLIAFLLVCVSAGELGSVGALFGF